MPFGLLSGRGRTCPARLWMVYGWLWEGRGPGMPGPYRAAIFAAGGALNVRRRGQDPSLQYLWKSRCLLGYWAVGAGHARPLQGGNFCSGRRPQRPAEGSRPLPTVLVEKQVPFGLLSGRGRACPARLWMVYGRLWEGCGPGMPGPYRGRLWGIRTVTGRPVKAP